MKTGFKTIDEYISAFPVSTQNILEELRGIIRETAPAATEKISYQMPTFVLNGRQLVYFAAYEHHIGFYPGAVVIQAFESELNNYKTAKGTIQFPLDHPLPRDLIKKIVKFKVEENSTRKKGS
jgi:uncharacterized protein YdhG (YjbR/CyaY superfamily)